jgi:hypothetical protein
MLWNGCLVSAVEGVKEVTWLQAWGLNFLFGTYLKILLLTKRINMNKMAEIDMSIRDTD